MIGRLRQLSEPMLRQQAGIEKSQTPIERDILVQWVRKVYLRIWYNNLLVTRRFSMLDKSTFVFGITNNVGYCQTASKELTIQTQTWSRGYKTFFMLNSVEHKILNAHKYKNIKKSAF